jgi:hypothetical protein
MKPAAEPRLPNVNPDVLEKLPPVLRAVVRALGVARADAFLRAYGGVCVELPAQKDAGYGLTAEELAALRFTLRPHLIGAGRVYLPKVDKLIIIARNAMIRRERSNTSVRRLALRYDLTMRHVTGICREHPDDDPQYDLF